MCSLIAHKREHKTVETPISFLKTCWILVLHHTGDNVWRNLSIALTQAVFRSTIGHRLPAAEECVALRFVFTHVVKFRADVLELVSLFLALRQSFFFFCAMLFHGISFCCKMYIQFEGVGL